MSSVQYLRQFSCILAAASGPGLEFADFKVEFVVRRTDLQTPNSCDVRIYNLSRATLNKIQNEFSQIQLKAGYEGTFDLVFNGTIKQRRQGRLDQIDTYIDITAADGDEAYNFAPLSVSMAAAQTNPASLAAVLFQQLKALAAVKSEQTIESGFQLTQGYAPKWPSNALPRGRVFYGQTRDELRDFAAANGVQWSIQDGALTFVPYKSYIPGTVPVIGPGTGLIGVPEQQQDGIHFRTLLNPLIKIGQLVKLDATVNLFRFDLSYLSQTDNLALRQSIKLNGDGMYYVLNVTHSGDTRGTEWYTDAICLAVDATLIPQGAFNALIAQSADVVLGG